ncbi:cbb3-type cytochrome oxidase assembly protein CcoS [Planctomycetaceae bacterium SH139]
MSVLYVALPVAILMGAAAVLACVICIRKGQFDDLESPAVRMLIDDEAKRKPHRRDASTPG